MAFSGKHTVSEIDGVRCTIVEQNVSKERMLFLKQLLEYNKHTVKVSEQTKDDKTTYTVGVTSIIFNPVIAVYEKSLKTLDDKRITPDYWNQKTTEVNPFYWLRT